MAALEPGSMSCHLKYVLYVAISVLDSLYMKNKNK